MRSIEGSIRKKAKTGTSKVEAELNEMIHSLSKSSIHQKNSVRRSRYYLATILDHKKSGGRVWCKLRTSYPKD